eukprot:gene31362-40748_t
MLDDTLRCLLKFENPVWTWKSLVLIICVPTHPGDPWSNIGVSYLTCYSYLMVASCTLCLTVISTRCAGIDATKKLLSAKQMFIHLAREKDSAAERELLERHGEVTVDDILNDMLLFDKIVSGIMTLEKRFFDPLDLVAKVLGPIHLLARESGIDSL